MPGDSGDQARGSRNPKVCPSAPCPLVSGMLSRVLARPPWGPFLLPTAIFFSTVWLHSGLVAAGRDIILSYTFLPEVHLSFG